MSPRERLSGPQTPEPNGPMPKRQPLADRHVLLVDDEPDFLDELRRYLRRRGWTVTATGTPGEALAQLNAHAGITVVVTDIRIGDLDGCDLATRILHEHCDRQAVSVMVVTGDGERAARSITDSPMDLPILHKPLAVPAFLEMLEAAHGRAKACRAA